MSIYFSRRCKVEGTIEKQNIDGTIENISFKSKDEFQSIYDNNSELIPLDVLRGLETNKTDIHVIYQSNRLIKNRKFRFKPFGGLQ